MKAIIPKSKRPLRKTKKTPALSMTRRDLSFTEDRAHSNHPGIMVLTNWVRPEIPAQANQWNVGRQIGLGMISELAALARSSEVEAHEAIHCALTADGWNPNGDGVEAGFSEGIAALAIVGLRHLALGGTPFDPANPQPAIYWTAKLLLEQQIARTDKACAAQVDLHEGRASGMASAFLNAGLIDHEAYMKAFKDLRDSESKRVRANQ